MLYVYFINWNCCLNYNVDTARMRCFWVYRYILFCKLSYIFSNKWTGAFFLTTNKFLQSQFIYNRMCLLWTRQPIKSFSRLSEKGQHCFIFLFCKPVFRIRIRIRKRWSGSRYQKKNRDKLAYKSTKIIKIYFFFKGITNLV